jgi:hypothetical protein
MKEGRTSQASMPVYKPAKVTEKIRTGFDLLTFQQ